MTSEFANYAFISYSHRDEKWAAWIQRKLEAYRLPSVIRKEAGSTVPERIRPVFRDATDLGAGRLRNNLQEELEASRFLIVVCSPNSARPNVEGKHWVNDEVTHFASLGRADRIVPVLIEGDEKTALCPKLRELGLLAVDATKKSRARTLNDIVAALLGLRPDELWHREERLHRRKRAWCIAACAAVLVLAVAGAWRWYDLAVMHVEYYSDWVDEWGIPTGIPGQRLSPNQVRNRLFSYRFEYRGRKKKAGFFAPRVLRRVVMLDVDGNVLGDNELFFPEDKYYMSRPRIQVLRYNEDGTLESIDDQDKNGVQLVRHRFSVNKSDVEHFRLVRGNEIDMPTASNNYDGGLLEFNEDAKHTEVKRFSHVRDTKGRIIKTLFKKDRSVGSTTRNADGAYGIEYRLDESGRPVREIFLGNRGEPHAISSGIAGRTRQFSESGQLILETTVNELERPRGDFEKGGYAQTHYDRDEFGNLKRISFRDEDGELTRDKCGSTGRVAIVRQGHLVKYSSIGQSGNPVRNHLGFSSYSIDRSEDNSIVTVSFLDENGLPCMCAWGMAAVREIYNKGDRVCLVCVDADGNPILCKDGTAGYLSEWDNHRETKRIFIDIDGNPTMSTEGSFGWGMEYDAEGFETKFAFLGYDGRPMLGPDGWASVNTEYKDGYPCCVAFYDENGQCTLTKFGMAGWKSRFEGGNEIERVFFGEDGQPKISADGTAGFACRYENGHLVEYRYLSLDRKPILNRYGVAGAHLSYDKAGRGICIEFFGLNREPVVDKAYGAAGNKFKYDDFGNETERWAFGVDGKPCCSKDGIAGWTAKYDEKGQMIEQIVRNPDGSPAIMRTNGSCGYRFEYDEHGNRTAETYLGADEKPMVAPVGFATARIEYDVYGNKTSQTFHDSKGHLISPLGFSGIAGVTNEYNRFGKQTKQTCIGTDGRPMISGRGFATEETLFDPLGRESGKRYYDAAGNLTIIPEGPCAGWDVEYDRRGNVGRKTWIGAEGKPYIIAEGYAGWRAEYDRWGREKGKYFFDDAGRPSTFEGVWGWQAEFDVFGNEICRTYFGIGQKPAPHRDGYTMIKAEYDVYNRCVRTHFLDKAGNPTLLASGVAARSWEYDAAGNTIKKMNLDENGNVIEDSSGWAIKETDYDAFHRVSEIRLINAVEKPTLEIDSGCAGWTCVSDINGNITNQLYFGINKEPKKHKNGYACISQTFERGLCTSVRYFGTNGAPVSIPAGYAGYEFRYDGIGRKTEQRYLDVEGKPCTDTNGCARMRWVYDERSCRQGLCTEYVELDLEGTLFSNAVHAAVKYVYEYDERGHETVRRFIDANGTVREGPNGFAIRTMKCDFAGRPVEQAYLDVDGKPVRSRENGVAIERREWDDRGNLVAVRYFDEKNMPCVCSNGYASVETIFDIRGYATNVLHRGVNGNLIALPASGCAGWTSEIDRLGNEVKRTWIGTDGKSVSNKNGAYGWISAFARGKETARRWIGADGEPCRASDGTLGWDKTYDEYGKELSRKEVK